MRKIVAVFFLSLWSHSVLACELPSDPRHFVDTMQEERDLTLRALAKSDLVFIGTVTAIRHGKEVADPGDRVSEVTADVLQLLAGELGQTTVVLQANLHYTVAPCFGNEAFWDDNVEQKGEYIFFVSDRKIISASPPAPGWNRLGLSGQRELVLAAIGRGP